MQSIREVVHEPQVERPDDAGEPALVASAQAGDDDAFCQLHARYEPQIFNHLYHDLLDKEVAEELTQETFLKAWLHIGRTGEGLLFGAWLFRIATNLRIDLARHERLVQMDRWEGWLTPGGQWRAERAGCLAALLASDDDQPEHWVLRRPDPAVLAQVHNVLNQLPTHYRRCLLLREWRELSYDEIAARLDTTIAAVKSLLFRARQDFRRRWQWRETGRPPRRPPSGVGRRRRLLTEERAAIRALKGAMSQAAAARQCGVAQATVWALWKKE